MSHLKPFLVAAAFALAALTEGCVFTPPECTECPALAGSFDVVWSEPAFSCSGTEPPTATTLLLTQEGPDVTLRLGERTFEGTIYSDSTFSLALRTVTDAGVPELSDTTLVSGSWSELAADEKTAQRLTGRYASTVAGGAGRGACTLTVPFTAYRR